MKVVALLLLCLAANGSAGYLQSRFSTKQAGEAVSVSVPNIQTENSRVVQGRVQPQVVNEQVAEKESEELTSEEIEDERISAEQAKSAHYSFASAVDDGIMDHSHVRQETRDGLKVTGSYSYSDGYFRRTVNYEADENGYRVVSEESEPIGPGPNIDLLHGKADVHTQINGVDTQYSIKADDIVIPPPTSNVSVIVTPARQQRVQVQVPVSEEQDRVRVQVNEDQVRVQAPVSVEQVQIQAPVKQERLRSQIKVENRTPVRPSSVRSKPFSY